MGKRMEMKLERKRKERRERKGRHASN